MVMTEEIPNANEESRNRKRSNVETCEDAFSSEERSGSDLQNSSGDEWAASKQKKGRPERNIPYNRQSLKSKLAKKTKVLKKHLKSIKKQDVSPKKDDTISIRLDELKILKNVEEGTEKYEQDVKDLNQVDVPFKAEENRVPQFDTKIRDTVCNEKQDLDVKPRISDPVTNQLTTVKLTPIKQEKTDNVKLEKSTELATSTKCEKSLINDRDTVIILSDDDDSTVAPPVVLNCTINKTFASPFLSKNIETIPSQSNATPSPQRLRVNPAYQVSPGSNPMSFTSPVNATSTSPSAFNSSFTLPSTNANLTSPIRNVTSTTKRGASTRGRRRAGRTPVSARGRTTPYTPRSPLISPQSTKVTPPSSHLRSRVSFSSSRLDISNISRDGTTIQKGANSVTITPTKNLSEKSPVQRKLFKNEVEGKIGGRYEDGIFRYVVNLANGTHLNLSEHQVTKLREQNNGVLPSTLRIPVPSDVAATIEPIFLIED